MIFSATMHLDYQHTSQSGTTIDTAVTITLKFKFPLAATYPTFLSAALNVCYESNMNTFSCSVFFLCCLIFFTSSGRSGIPFPASSSCSAAYSRQKAPVRPTPELRRKMCRLINATLLKTPLIITDTEKNGVLFGCLSRII